MTSYLDSFVRVSLVLGFALLALPLLRGRSAAARRLVLSIAFAVALVVPLVPAWHVDAPAYHALVGRVVVEPLAAIGVSTSAAAPVAVARSIDGLALAWSLGAFVVALRFGVGVLLARRLVASASAPVGWASAIARAEQRTRLRAVVRVSARVEAPAVTGMVAPVILVPAASATWTEERKLAVLLHELAHVAANDLAVQMLVATACSLHWFNPIAWLAARRLRLERELAADEAVLRSGVRASSYAADLLAIAGAAPLGAIALGDKPLTKRIAAIVATKRPARLGGRGAALLALGSSAVALGVACTTSATTTTTSAPVIATDRALQAIAERELAGAVATWKAKGGTVLVLSPRGEVLASAGGHADQPYVAGSTMKSFLLATALDEDVVKESDVFDCSKGARAGKVMFDASPHGNATLPEMIAVSSNIGFAQLFDRVGGATYDRALHRFHFATPPSLATAQAGDWDGSLIAIGATMSTTPREVASAYAALADGGDGIVTPQTASRVTALLENVVASDDGTGKAARVSGVRVAGKTGTSSWTAADGTDATYASFVGYAPADKPRYVIFVGVESPAKEGSGGEVAAPVFARIAKAALGH